MAKTKKMAIGGATPAMMIQAGPGPKPLQQTSGISQPMPVQQMPGNTPPGRTAMPAGNVNTFPRPVGTPLGAPRITPPTGRVTDLGPGRVKPTIMPTGGRMKKGGSVKSSASKRADGIAQRGKTKGKFV